VFVGTEEKNMAELLRFTTRYNLESLEDRWKKKLKERRIMNE
jgi:hypothetical protein